MTAIGTPPSAVLHHLVHERPEGGLTPFGRAESPDHDVVGPAIDRTLARAAELEHLALARTRRPVRELACKHERLGLEHHIGLGSRDGEVGGEREPASDPLWILGQLAH